MAFKKFPVTVRSSFGKGVKALQDRFEPENRKDLYVAEFQTWVKTRTESWPDFGEDLRILVDEAYPSLDDEAQQQLALQRYLSQLDNEQVAFGVKQRKPKTIDAAVGATLELESYLVKPKQGMVVAVNICHVVLNENYFLSTLCNIYNNRQIISVTTTLMSW